MKEFWIQLMRAMIGIPDYPTYVAHQKEKHPGSPVLSYEDFFRVCQTKRYEGGRGGRCC